MRKPGALNARCSPLLLTTAALLDFTIILALTSMLIQPIDRVLEPYDVPALARTIAIFGSCVLLYWAISELILGGLSVGRMVLGLKACDSQGKPLSRKARMRRAAGKLSTLGLTGVNPVIPARYDTKAGVVWHSPIAAAQNTDMGEWRLVIKSGSLRTRSARLNTIPRFRKHGEVRFGRDGKWADVVFSESDRSVSGQHASLILHKNRLFIRDGNGAKPSSHGTVLGGQKLKANEARSIRDETNFSLGGVQIELRR